MQFVAHLLGPVRLSGPDHEIFIRSRRTRGLLAALLFGGPIMVMSSRLVEAVWECPPRSAAMNLRTLASQLRSHLDSVESGLGDRLVTLRGAQGSGGGYRLYVESDECDLHTFRARCAEGRAANIRGDAQASAKILRLALDLWDGPAGIDLPATRQIASRCEALNELRLHTMEDYHHVMLGMGFPAEVLPDVHDMLESNPLRERSWTHLIRGQYLGGEIGAALESYRSLRGLLDRELGIEPCPSTQRLHLSVLHGDTERVRYHEWIAEGDPGS